MLRQDPFDRFLSDMSRNLKLVEELELTLDQIHHTVSRGSLDYDSESLRFGDLGAARAC